MATRTENAQEVFEAVHYLDLEVGIVTNNKAMMVLSAGVNKATGLAAALAELGIPAQRVVAIGDRENDIALFEFTGCGVAVANAPTTVKSTADLVTRATAGVGFRELVDHIITTDLVEVQRCVESRDAYIHKMAA